MIIRASEVGETGVKKKMSSMSQVDQGTTSREEDDTDDHALIQAWDDKSPSMAQLEA